MAEEKIPVAMSTVEMATLKAETLDTQDKDSTKTMTEWVVTRVIMTK